jgi:hypothetical protein
VNDILNTPSQKSVYTLCVAPDIHNGTDNGRDAKDGSEKRAGLVLLEPNSTLALVRGQANAKIKRHTAIAETDMAIEEML